MQTLPNEVFNSVLVTACCSWWDCIARGAHQSLFFFHLSSSTPSRGLLTPLGILLPRATLYFISAAPKSPKKRPVALGTLVKGEV